MRPALILCLLVWNPVASAAGEPLESLLSGAPSELDWFRPVANSPGDCGCIGELLSADDCGLSLDEVPNWQLGGSYRIRYHNEHNMRRAGLTGNDDEFLLHQTRIWLEGDLNDRIRMRAGGLDAASSGESLRPRAAEVNRFDLYQLYLDVLLGDVLLGERDGTWTVRLGRQELRLGSARLIMAPIWANRRRTNDGVRLMRRGPEWDIDAFWMRPAVRDVDSFNTFDSTDHERQLYGVFSTYRGAERSTLELYWLAFDIDNPAGGGGARYDTIGSRIYGDTDHLLFELEGGIQFGRNPDGTVHSAGFFTGGIGKAFEPACWSPEVWLFYDFASGSGDTGNGFHTYVQRAHYYLGWMDLFGRRNLEDLNLRLSLKPADDVTLVLWYHYFSLATGKDVPYNLNMQPFNGLAAGSAGSQELGHELDMSVTWQMNDRTQFRVGYSHFWAGRFYDTTPGVPTNSDADFFYSHFQITF